MSGETWANEFYPTMASETLEDPIEATRHSLVKWRGLRPEVLQKHGIKVTSNGRRILEAETLKTVIAISDGTCALCYHYFRPDRKGEECDECPLAKARDGVACTEPMELEDYSPWDEWRQFQNPDPMIQELERTFEELGGTEEPPVWP